jgi:uncharacterized protein YwlG (UPF0340 family)
MKIISCGWQYIVYDIGNERVRKVKHNKLTQTIFIFIQLIPHKTPIHIFTKLKEHIIRVNKMEKSSNEYIKSILNIIPKEIIGNPVFINDTDYEQDKVSMIEHIYKKKK